MKKKILTAGSGPSYSQWRYWPTWTALLPLSFRCTHKDVSAPAAGNLYIARSIIRAFEEFTPDLVLVQWNMGKFDLYVEDQKFINLVLNSNSTRNFIVDPKNSKTTENAGYWCSSNDNTIEWKKYYNENIKSDTGTAMNDLQNMLTVQNFCDLKKIKYGFFLHNDVNHKVLANNPNIKSLYQEIDWTRQIAKESIATVVDAHPSKIYNVSPERRSIIPCADIQWFLLDSIVAPFLESTGFQKNKKYNSLKNICSKFTENNYKRYQ